MREIKDIEEVAFARTRRCIDFENEFQCPNCFCLLVPVCVNLGLKEGGFYCMRDFPNDCSEFGCPKYRYVYWEELERYRFYGEKAWKKEGEELGG